MINEKPRTPRLESKTSTIHIPYPVWKRMHERMSKLDMPVKLQSSIEGFSANVDALVNSGLWHVAQDEPEISGIIRDAFNKAERFNIVITGRPGLYGHSRPVDKIERHETMHVKFDNLPEYVKQEMFSSLKSRKDYPKLYKKLQEHYGRYAESEDEIIEEWYVRTATDPLNVRIWLGASSMPQKKQWKLIDNYLKGD